MNLLVGVLSKSYDHYFGRALEIFVRERAILISSLRTRPWVRNPPKEWESEYLWFAMRADREEVKHNKRMEQHLAQHTVDLAREVQSLREQVKELSRSKTIGE